MIVSGGAELKISSDTEKPEKLNLEAVYWKSVNRDYNSLVNRVLAPSPEEIRKFGVRAKDFIVSCTFDGKPCSYKCVTF
jgi:hypothetical protein